MVENGAKSFCELRAKNTFRLGRYNSSNVIRTRCNWFVIALCSVLCGTSLLRQSEAGLTCLSNPCIFGVCIDDLNSTYSCYCIDGYTGVHCQTNWDECWSSPCQNGGTCIDGIATYNCTCPDGFLGLNCEENYNECQSNPCQNGGVCHDRDNAFFCTCAQGYEGEYCQEDIAVCDTGDRCHNGGICVEGPGLEFSCRCADGYEGRLCDSETNECDSSPCQNGAICIDKFASYVCACPMGFSGTNCEEEIMICASSPCANQALCLMEEDQPVCYCVPDFHGERCELQYDECQLGPEPRCVNGGTCVDGVDEYFCSCMPNFSGENCECLVQDDSNMDCNYTAPEITTIEGFTMTEGAYTTSYWTTSVPDLSTIDIGHGSSAIATMFYENVSTPTLLPAVTGTSQIDDTVKPTSLTVTDPNIAEEPFKHTTDWTTDNSSQDDSSSSTPKVTASEQTTDSGVSYSTVEPKIPTSTTSEVHLQNYTTVIFTDITVLTSTKSPTSEPATTDANGISERTTFLPSQTDASSISPERSTAYVIDGVSSDLGGQTTQAPTISPELSSFFTETPVSSTTAIPAEDQVTKLVTTPASVEESPSVPSTSSVFTTLMPTTFPPTDIQECDDTVCANGGTCAMTATGVKCHCDFRFVGTFCNIPVSIQNAAFSRDSFLRHVFYRRNESIPPNATATLDPMLIMLVKFKAKLTSRDGLILLATTEGNEGSHYVALLLQKGLLQFQFSCGLQTMLLSEIEGPVNNGYELNIKVQLNFNARYSYCNASLHVNETLAMSGEQPTWLTKAKSPGDSIVIRQSWLHLGGRPIKTMYTLSHNISRYQGFTGCIYELEVNQKPVAVFDNAEDAYKIYECTSLACLSSPCRNGAVCVEEGGGQGLEKWYKPNTQGSWSCKCAFGYMGKMCEQSVCDNNPCRFGGTCVTFPESGYLCLCPYGKHGHFCEHDLDILQPSFFGSIKGLSSYIAYPLAFPFEDRFEFSFKIIPTTISQISLLSFVGQLDDHNEHSDHFSVSFIQGFVLVTWNLGSGPRRIFTQQPIQVQSTRPTTIHVGRNGRMAWLSIDGKVNISGNSPGNNVKLNVAPYLYIGGHEQANFSSLPHDLPLHSGFQGCLFDIHIVAGPVHIPLQHIGGMRGRSVGQCGTKECHRHACQNNGACLQHGSTFTCICQEDWHGILCSQKNNPCDDSNKCSMGSTCFPLIAGYECDCQFGKIGKRCEFNLKYLSDVSFSGRRSFLALQWPSMVGDLSYLENEVKYEKIVQHSHIIPQNHSILLKSIKELDKLNDVLKVDVNGTGNHHFTALALSPRSENYRQLKIRQFSIEMQVRPLSEKGLLLFVRTYDSNEQQQGFISLSLQGGVVEYRVSSFRLPTFVVRSNHVLAIGEWHLIKMVKYGKRLTLWVEGKSTSVAGSVRDEFISANSRIYFGGLSDLSNLPFDAMSGYPVSFRGCIRNVILNGTRVTLNESSIMDSRNINDCDGTPCGGDLCAKGGLCWLDEHSQPHCKCPEYSKGINCEIQEPCDTVKCRNNGQCMKNGRCSCNVGWTGNYCEIPTTKFSALGFNDRSYILIPSQKIKMKDKRNDISGNINSRLLELHISFNISTITDGVVFWTTDSAGRYFGIGVKDGFLTIASNMLLENENTSKAYEPWKAFVADGDWHHIELETSDNHIHIHLDGYNLFNELQFAISGRNHSFDKLFLSEELTYLGGFPEDNVHNRTFGVFRSSFSGCIQNIYLANQPDELDYTAYEGANISECEF